MFSVIWVHIVPRNFDAIIVWQMNSLKLGVNEDCDHLGVFSLEKHWFCYWLGEGGIRHQKNVSTFSKISNWPSLSQRQSPTKFTFFTDNIDWPEISHQLLPHGAAAIESKWWDHKHWGWQTPSYCTGSTGKLGSCTKEELKRKKQIKFNKIFT